jgi:glycosyltransferase involved in cell wall biosynthesis
MRILYLNSTYREGGAAIAAARLMEAFYTESDIEVRMLVQKPPKQNAPMPANVRAMLRRPWQKGPYWWRTQRHRKQLRRYKTLPRSAFSTSCYGIRRLERHPWIQWADVLHLHWISDHYVSAATLQALGRLGKPIFWTLHDMWAFTGGCHYAGDCRRFQAACGACPLLKSSTQEDLSRVEWQRKYNVYQALKPKIICPSTWMLRESQSSSLLGRFVHQRIPYSLDTEIFSPPHQREGKPLPARPHPFTLLFGGVNAANDPRKGFAYLLAALEHLADEVPQEAFRLLVFGSEADPSIVDQLPFPTGFTGKVRGDRKLAEVYRQADLFIAPSLEDNLPNTVIEALACSLPIVAFNIGGMADMVQTDQTGYLARPREAADLAQGIRFCADPDRFPRLRRQARQFALRHFDAPVVAAQMLDAYQQALKG